eukprot:TRINITY_DN69847_c0_g1_i1.p1 TRINITY_DN69847_c0_g1~~TRINITY_DN69847_c0_g1_i1.p1  ORF type:complete len:371 (-),score=66.07 TRINITY_DN69847_c0_g1_i1:28-1095(-)
MAQGLQKLFFAVLIAGHWAELPDTDAATCAAGDTSPGCSGEKQSPKLKAKAKKCSLPEGDDLVPPRQFTISQAMRNCKELSGCKAVTARVGEDFQQKSEYLFHFKAQLAECRPDPSWRTVLLGARSEVRSSSWPGPPLAEHFLRYPKASLVVEDPPVVRIEDFLSDSEVEHIVAKAGNRFVKSSVGMSYDEGSTRTSETAWLNDPNKDYEDPILREITARITGLTAVPHTNMEPFQVVRYKAGQLFNGHNDYLDEQEQQVCGGRVGTFFMYLNDVPEGGETFFKHWNITVTPRRGLALLWWNSDYNALRESKFERQKHMHAWHAALEVKRGEKWVVNRWLHPYDFLTPYHAGKLR